MITSHVESHEVLHTIPVLHGLEHNECFTVHYSYNIQGSYKDESWKVIDPLTKIAHATCGAKSKHGFCAMDCR